MDLRVLEYFLAVADEQNLTRAAEKVTTSQSNLSHQIKSLERELGCTLFTRGDNYFSLTEQGLYLRKQARELLALSEKTRETILNFDSDASGEVRIGGAETNAIHIIGRTIKRMQEKYPGIHYYIGSGADYDVFEPLERGLLDFALVVPPVNKEKYNWRLMPMKDEIGFLVPAKHPLAKLTAITPEKLKAYPIQVGGDALKRQGRGTIWEKVGEEIDAVVTFNLVTNPMLMVQDGVPLSAGALHGTGRRITGISPA